MDKGIRKESSVPVQTRVSIVDLAKMDLYWRVVESTDIRTMSQLVSWTFTALVDIIEANEKMPEGIDSILAAHKHLTARGLYQRGMRKKSQSRISAMLGFENLRMQESDPSVHSSRAYNLIHSEHSAEPFTGKVSTGKDIDWDEVNKRISEEDAKELEESMEKTLKDAEDSGALVDETVKAVRHDKEVARQENAPLKEEDFKLVDE